MGYPESDRKQLFYQWRPTGAVGYNYVLDVYFNNQWWQATDIRTEVARELTKAQEVELREYLRRETDSDFGGFELVQA
jgi:hypothetical protein